ncbi:MAG: M15 family metallopeptidase [Acidimicrobiia bacterium]
MTRGAVSVVVVLLAVMIPATVIAAEEPPFLTVWQAGGMSPATLEAVRVAAAIENAQVAIRRSGSLRLMGVTRGAVDVQRPAEGFGYPMSSLAVEIQDPSLHPDVAAALGPTTVVMSERSAALRGAKAGDVLEIEGWNRQVFALEIGAVLPDETVGWYEIVLSDRTAVDLGFDRPASAVVWGGRLGQVPSTMRWFSAAPTVKIGSPSDPIVFTDATLPTVVVKERFGEFAFRPTGVADGIEIEASWLDANIVDVNIDGLGPFRCNRAVVPYIRAAVSELERTGLMAQVDYSDFQLAGGCFNARMMRGSDQGFALSRHAWGIAIDFNPSTNRFGGETSLTPAFGEVLRRWGFSWGTTWTIPDGMHFEWVRTPEDIDVCAPFRLTGGEVWTVEAAADACSALG